jgi:hypothetical protein
MSQSRVTEKTQAWKASAAGRRLAEWLNSPHSKGHAATKIVVLTQALMHAAQHSKYRLEGEDFEEYKREIDRIARKFPGVCELEGMDARHPGSAWFVLRSFRKSRREIDGWGVVNDVRILAEAGALWKIRRCALPSCKRAFSASFPHQVFHDEKCKEKQKRASLDFKKRRNEKAADNYREGLLPEAKRKLDKKRARRKVPSVTRQLLDELSKEAKDRERSKC